MFITLFEGRLLLLGGDQASIHHQQELYGLSLKLLTSLKVLAMMSWQKLRHRTGGATELFLSIDSV